MTEPDPRPTRQDDAPRFGPTYGPTHAETYGPLFPPTPPFGVTRPPVRPPARPSGSLAVRLLVGLGLLFAVVVAVNPGLGLVRDARDEPALPAIAPTADEPGAVSPATWFDIARDPAAYAGRRIVVFGRISAAPEDGGRAVRATLGPLPEAEPFPTPALVTRAAGSPGPWTGVRPGDVVRIEGTLRPPDGGTSPRVVVEVEASGLGVLRR